MLFGSAGQQPPPPPSAGADEIRDAADEILARPEFQEPAKSLYQQALEFLSDRLDDVLNALLGGGRAGVLAWLLVALSIAALGYLIVRGVQLDRRRRTLTATFADIVETGRPPTAWDEEAVAFEAQGNWRAALRCRYRSLIAALARGGLIDEVPGRTAGEYRVAVIAARPETGPAFGPATDLFERAWYSGLPTRSEDLAAFRDLAERVRADA